MKDEQIIDAIKRGDEGAIHDVITRYSRLMWSIVTPILYKVGCEEDMEECVADVFVYLWENPDKYDAGRGGLKTWLSIVARSQAIDRYRTLAKEQVLPLSDTLLTESGGLCDGILTEETRKMLTAAIQSLDQPEQEILVRRYCYEQKPKEIAAALDLPKKKVENHLYRAKAKLRKLISSEKKEGHCEFI